MLPALAVDGYLVCNIYRGGVNKEIFIEFLEEYLLPLCNPYPNPKSVIVMDNVETHRGEVKLNLCLLC